LALKFLVVVYIEMLTVSSENVIPFVTILLSSSNLSRNNKIKRASPYPHPSFPIPPCSSPRDGGDDRLGAAVTGGEGL